MAITFYYGAGSPFAWRVWFALEHKGIAFDLKVLSFSAGDTRKPEFVALNPRHQVPTITDGAFALYESAAIVEYLEEVKPQPSLFPGDAQQRARIRRMVCEADQYFTEANNKLLTSVLFAKPEEFDRTVIASARAGLLEEIGNWEKMLTGDYLAGSLSAADFTLYPMLAIALRCDKKKPDLSLRAALPPRITAWMKRIEALPYFEKTWPAHWK
jgi:glutathione S-transferase